MLDIGLSDSHQMVNDVSLELDLSMDGGVSPIQLSYAHGDNETSSAASIIAVLGQVISSLFYMRCVNWHV